MCVERDTDYHVKTAWLFPHATLENSRNRTSCAADIIYITACMISVAGSEHKKHATYDVTTSVSMMIAIFTQFGEFRNWFKEPLSYLWIILIHNIYAS